MATRSAEERPARTFLWKIENFVFYDREIHGNEIQSPNFTTRMSQTTWYISLYPKGVNETDKFFRIYLMQGFERPRITIDCELSFLGGDGSPLVTGTMRNKEVYPLSSLETPDCPTHEEVFVSRKSAFLPNDTLTVRCRVWKSVGNFPKPECVFLCSRLELTVDSFRWPIKGFTSLPLDEKKTTTVEVCIAGRRKLFLLNFYLTGWSFEEAVARIELGYLCINSDLSATLKVSVLDGEEKALKSVEGKHLFEQSEDNRSWVLPELAKRKELLAKQSDCLSGDVLTLLCECTVVGDISHFVKKIDPVAFNDARHCGSYSDASSQTDARKDSICSDESGKSSVTLGEDLMSLYRDHTGSDFELSSGDVSFPVHKQVLMARSPVFRAMFCNDMKESGTHSLEVPDVDAHTLNRMLTFLYSDTVDPELQWEGAARLYYAADKYQVPSLKQRCSSVLQSGISVSNVGNILTLADRHQDQELTSSVHHFFLRNFDAILLSEEWYTFLDRDPSLAGKTLKKVHQKKLQLRSD